MISDNEIKECVKKLQLYCLEHLYCENCIFKPANYKAEINECLVGRTPADINLKESAKESER